MPTANLQEPIAAPYRDLNRNGKLDVYEDRRQSTQARVDDLLSQMTLEEKAGALLHGNLPAVDSPFGASDRGYELKSIGQLVARRHISSFITRLTMPPQQFAEMNNAVQRIGQESRLGIPITISSDPRNHFLVVAGASNRAKGFSMWPEPLGFAALGDRLLVKRFGLIAAREYRAVGIHMALSPQADLVTDPRWPRSLATFGSDPATVSQLAGAYVQGFQGSSTGVTRTGVAAVVKHWLGYGAQPGGFDAHNYYGREAIHSSASLAVHEQAFAGPLAARAAGVMPTYAIVRVPGSEFEAVGAGFSRQLVAERLRRRHHYEGLIVSDWGILNDCPASCKNPTRDDPQTVASIGMPWGVESLTAVDRVSKGINAGLDQFGGFENPEPILQAIKNGSVTVARLNESVRRVMALKFNLGLFDNPYVDPASAADTRRYQASQKEADTAQRAAQVLLQNTARTLPLRPGARVWLFGFDPAATVSAGLVPSRDLRRSDYAIIRLQSPAERLHPYHFFGRGQSEGSLDFSDNSEGLRAIVQASSEVPTIVVVDLDRPAVLTKIAARSKALVAVFGASDQAVLDVLTGRAPPQGRLPLNLPRSMAAVEKQDPAVPDDDARPLYPRGWGCRYRKPSADTACGSPNRKR